MIPLFRRTAACGVFLASLGFALRVAAADQFPVSEAQMRALGITVQRLDRPRAIAGLTYPAQVTLPRSAERVVSAPVDGMVSQILVEENATVKAGQPLLRLDSPGFGALQLDVLEVVAEAKLAEQSLTRAQQLFAEGVIAERRVEEARVAASSARARMAQARAAVRLAGVDEASVERLASDGEVLDALVIRSKLAGTVLRVDMMPGQRVSAGDVLMRVGDVSQLWLEIQIPAESARRWRPGESITVTGRNATAKALSLGATVGDGQSLVLRATVDSGKERLRPGEFVQVQVPFADGGSSWAVPITAVVRREAEAFVFVRSPAGFSAVPVKITSSAGQRVSVEGALKAGDAVAVTSVVALKAAWLGESGGD